MKKIALSILSIFTLLFIIACDEFGVTPPRVEYTVRYYYHLEDSEISNEITVYENDFLVEPKISKDLHTLEGWYMNLEDPTTKWDFRAMQVSGNLALHAKWDLDQEVVSVNNITLTDSLLSFDYEDDVTYELTLLGETHILESNTFDFEPYKDLITSTTTVTIKPIKVDFISLEAEVLIIYREKFENELLIDFEGHYYQGYIQDTIIVNGYELRVVDFLIQGSAGDKFEGARAARLRAGSIEFDFEFNNFNKLTYDIASFSAHGPVDVLLYANNAGGEPVLIQTNTTTSELVKTEVSELSLTEKGIKTDEPITFKIEKATSTQNVNIDNINITVKPTTEYELTKGTPSDIELIDYFKSAEGLTGEELLLELRLIISSNHRQTSYGEARYILEVSDRDPEDNYETVRGMYDGDKIATHWIGTGAGSWQREHVWPNSKLGRDRTSNSTRDQSSDIHNLRAITSINQTRSNRYFVAGTGSAGTVGTEGFYPGENDKGDVARILMYMAVRYEFLKLTSNENLLKNNSTTNYTMEGAYGGRLDQLLAWHIEDPVDQLELNRNELFYSGSITEHDVSVTAQGNRNPFIDHPQLFKAIFDYFTEIDEDSYLILKDYTYVMYINYYEFRKSKDTIIV